MGIRSNVQAGTFVTSPLGRSVPMAISYEPIRYKPGFRY